MAIENGILGGRFHFDLSARLSRSVEREYSTFSPAKTNDASVNQGNFYTRANSINVLEKALSEELGKRVGFDSNSRNESPARTIVKNVLGFVRQELREARSNGASEQQLQTILNKAAEGIQAGFAQAKDILQSRLDTNPRLERQIERAFNRIERGLERLDNRFAPSVDSQSVAQANSQNQVANGSSADADANNVGLVSAAPNDVTAANESRQIEFTKTKSVERSRSFQLSIQTQEGDTVNLSIEKSYSKQFSKQATFNDEGFSVNIERQVQREKQVSYQVSGDINEQEQAAIDKLIRNVDRLADKFYSGNLAGAFQKAARIGIDADQLANFSLNLQSSKSVEVTKTYREVQGAPATQEPSPVASLGAFIGDVAQAANEDAITNAVSEPLPVATELFKQIAVRDERYSQLVVEQSVEVVDQVIEDLADLARSQIEQAA